MENVARQGERLLAIFRAMAERHELMKDVRGKGLMLGVEFGTPKSFALKMSWNALETVNAGLFCQMITIPLFKEHKILVQVAGHASHTVKLLPPLTISDEDSAWIENAFEATIAAAHKVPGAVWSLGKTLADHALRAQATA
jgi:ornithine--oxo-acid transaminase